MKEKAPARYRRAAARWHARLVLDTTDIGLGDSKPLLAALAALPDPRATATLTELAHRYGVANVDSVLRQFR
jgi:hypothetical protein